MNAPQNPQNPQDPEARKKAALLAKKKQLLLAKKKAALAAQKKTQAQKAAAQAGSAKTKAPTKKTASKKKVATKAKGAEASTSGRKKDGEKVKLRSDKKTDHTVHRVLPKKSGLGVGTKFTLFIVLLLIFLIGVGQFVAMKVTETTLSEEIDQQGVLLCHTLAGAGEDTIKGLGLEAEVESGGEVVKKSVGSMMVDAIASNEKINDVLLGVSYMKKMEGNQYELVFGSPKTVKTMGKPLTISGVKRTDGTVQADGRETQVRSYELTVNGEIPVFISVYLKSERLAKIRSTMLNNTMIIAAASLLIGILGAMFLAKAVANPIKTLGADMLKVASGDLKHRTTVKRKDEVGVLANAFNMMGADLEIAHKAELEKLEMDRDIALAHDIQSSLLPATVPSVDGYEIEAFYRSAKDVGGDSYDVLEVDEDRIALLVTDVAGKGVQGAMIMAMTRGITRSYIKGSPSAAMILSRVNHSLAQDLKPGSFVTAMLVLLNHKKNEVTLASAGHNHMVLVRNGQKTCETHNPNGIALGIDKGPLFNKVIQEQTIPLNVGDRVVIYTDGVPEAMSPEHEEFGDKRFHNFCIINSRRPSDKFVEGLVGALDEHKSTGPQHDDITIVTLRKMK